jgi:hypothetical protein
VSAPIINSTIHYDWQDPTVLHINRLPPRADFVPMASMDEALTGNIVDAREASSRVQNLNGEWQFRWLPAHWQTPADFHAPAFDASDWGALPVPAAWQLHGHEAPAYANVRFPFPVDAPYVPDMNPVGLYRRTFAVATRRSPRRRPPAPVLRSGQFRLSRLGQRRSCRFQQGQPHAGTLRRHRAAA